MTAYIELSATVPDPETGERLIAQLSELGFEGFEEDGNAVRAFVTESAYAREAVSALLQAMALPFTERMLPPVNWNKAWEANFQPVTVDDFCLVRAAFHEPQPGFVHEIVITPKMSFGTGHHATTWMMIAHLRELDLRDKRVLDFGTGTGILAIVAERCGARDVLAIDNDPVCLESARENAEANGCRRLRVAAGTEIPREGPFDIILANINLNTILDNLPRMRQHLAAGGVIVASGVLPGDEKPLKEAVLRAGLRWESVLIRDQWLSFRSLF